MFAAVLSFLAKTTQAFVSSCNETYAFYLLYRYRALEVWFRFSDSYRVLVGTLLEFLSLYV